MRQLDRCVTLRNVVLSDVLDRIGGGRETIDGGAMDGLTILGLISLCQGGKTRNWWNYSRLAGTNSNARSTWEADSHSLQYLTLTVTRRHMQLSILL
jgi:hypothetical protein